MLLHESNHCLLKPLNVVGLHVRVTRLVTKWSDHRRPARIAVKEAPHAHYLSGINQGILDRIGLRLLNSLGESLRKCVHGV
jgi:hypothetical protein